MIPAPPDHALAQAAMWLLAGATALTVLVAGAALGVHVADARRQKLQAQRFARWTPLLLALIEGDIPPGAFVAIVRPRQRPDALRLLVRYAIRLRGPGYRRLCAAAEPLLPLALADLKAWRPERRMYGAFALGLLGRESAFDAVVAALNDPSRPVAFAAARALARMGVPAGIGPVLGSLGRFGHIHTEAVASLLARFGLRAGAPLMKALLEPGREAPARIAIVEALRRLSYVPAADLAAQLLIDGREDRETTVALLGLLLDIGDPHHAEAVRPYADAGGEEVRLHALSTLARLGGSEEDAWRLAYALDHPNPWMALRAASGLREVGYGELLREQATSEGRLRPFASLTLGEE